MRIATLNEALDRAARSESAGLRFLDRRENASWLSFASLRERAGRVAGGLAQIGLRPGERVALVFSTSPDFFDAFFGALLAGCVPVPLYPPVRLGRLGEYHARTSGMLEAVGARIVLAEPRVRRLLGETIAAADPKFGCRLPADLPEGEPPAVRPKPEDLALVQFSSGTTVEPKPVALTHRAILSQVEVLNGFWPDRGGIQHSGVSWLPLYHDMGLIGCVLPALERPSVLTLIPPEVFVARPAVWLRAISRYGATISPAPNFAYGLCLEKIEDEELEGVDLRCWRVALNGAEAVAPRVLREFAGRFSRWGFAAEALTPVYGLSEAALAVTFSSIDRHWVSRRFDRYALQELQKGVAARDGGVEIASVGRPLPGFELEVRRPDGAPCPPDEVGEVWVRGPSLMSGYLGQEEATARVMRDGWLDTGDRGFVFENELYLTGRSKDLIIVRGRNHSPEEIEQALDAVEGVRKGCSAAVARLDSRDDREEVVLFVEVRKQVGPEAKSELETACRREVLAAAGIEIDEVVVLLPGTLPRTSSGKIRRAESLARHQRGQLTPPEAVSPWSLARSLTRSVMAFRRVQRGS